METKNLFSGWREGDKFQRGKNTFLRARTKTTKIAGLYGERLGGGGGRAGSSYMGRKFKINYRKLISR